jgi:hypothetical protein
MEREGTAGRPGIRSFRIWVQGRLDEGFCEGLAGIEQQDVATGTMLSGALLDQAQLHGTLDVLRSLGIEVLRFEVDPLLPSSSTGLAEHAEAAGEAMGHRQPHQPTERPSLL